ncbi:LysR family transcriptional regulator [Enterococcus silesiacus]|uniref:LysR family transcriptional regulator n=1 Tax=Enterococcus silesiacus TaxID=332949 RepID=A0A0S3K7Y0_9ENTE|nr:LysR family transcriptional regulator [Enterococcus silesiacus]ALS00343.1 LysR family transcriptional regulator [Enterococcus silesiacus]OJG93333.1 hypothetical protein RV15_GL001365 [Enterococcus silesiacus]
MKLTTLNYFVAVAAEGSFTKASEKLYISQPTLSRRIQELETELGVELFIRHSHGLTLSNAGEQFLTAVSEVLKRVDHLSHMFDSHVNSDKTVQILKIGYLQNFNMGRMYELLECFKRKHPNIQFLMKQDTPMNLANGLSTNQYDLVFNLSTYFQPDQTVEKTVFMKNYLQIAVPFDHVLSHKKELDFADLGQETFILLERQHSPVIVDYVISQGIKNGFNLKVDFYVNDLDEGLSMVSLGKGLAFLYSRMDDGTLEGRYHIKILNLQGNSKEQDIVVAFDRNNQNYFLRELFTFVKKNVEEL